MRSFIITWMFIFSIVLLDIGYTCCNHKTMHEWEFNPFQRMLLDEFGYQSCVWFRLFSYIFAISMAIISLKYRKLITSVAVLMSIILGLMFLTMLF